MNNLEKTLEMAKKYAAQMRRDGVGYVTSCGKKSSDGKKCRGDAGNAEALDKLCAAVRVCRECHLCKSRKNAVCGEGNYRAKLMFVGEGPGFDEDRLGRPFVGRSGQLLDTIIGAMKMKREDVYITNIVKCHPMIDPSNPDKRGNDRKPSPDEIAACIPYLEKQISLIKPKVICGLGSVSGSTLLKLDIPIGKLRGKFYTYRGIKFMPTYHPAALLRNQDLKKFVWEDMKMIIRELE